MKKKILVIYILSSSFLMLFFVNMKGGVDISLDEVVAESEKVSRLRMEPGLSDEALGLLDAQQQKVSNVIAIKSLSTSCEDLVQADKNMVSGSYMLYPEGDLKKGKMFYCKVSQGKISQQISMDVNSLDSGQGNINGLSKVDSLSCSGESCQQEFMAQLISKEKDAEINISRIYIEVLKRRPDVEGLKFWVEVRLKHGWSFAQIREKFYQSDEYKQNRGKLESIEYQLRALYLLLLDRDIDPSGLSHYSKKLVAGWSLKDVADHIMQSDEYKNRQPTSK